jgi:hypothetical protein
VADDSALNNTHRAFIVNNVLATNEVSRRRIKTAAKQAINASLERTICRDLRKLLPGESTSLDNADGEVMRRAKVFAEWPEYQEFLKKNPQREKYAKQAANVRARRAAYKQRELAISTNSMSSKVQDMGVVSPSHTSSMPKKKVRTTPSTSAAKTLAPFPIRREASTNPFEVLSSMPVEVTEVSNSNSEASSASAHFKRKKPRKQIPLGHRPVTRSRTNSGNMEDRSIYVGSYNPLYNEPTNVENDLVNTAGSDEPKDDESHSQNGNSGPTHEEVLMANSGGSAEQQVAQLEAALRQKEEELAALRRQVADKAANGENERPEGSRTNNQNDPPLSVEAIQRMISEGVKAQYMQTHYSMRPGYVKPYPPEVDMVPFPDNYRQPQFTKFNGTGSPHEHVAHFLAACQDTSHNGALLLR